MTTTPDDSLDARWRRVALATKACPDKGEDVGWKDGVHTEFGYRPFQDMPHGACSGTGQALRFPALVRECGGDDLADCANGKATRYDLSGPDKWPICTTCHGAGVVPIEPDLDVLLSAALAEYEWVSLEATDEAGWWVGIGPKGSGDADTPLAAALAAIEAALADKG